jgi:hypothetical protein
VAIWNQFRSILFGGAIGAAARTAIEPQIEPARQLAWSNNRNRILDLSALAALVAEGAVGEADVADLVGRHGFELDSLRALVELDLAAPELGTLMSARRRDELTDAEFEEGLSKLRIRPDFRPAIRALLGTKLSPADVANAVQQGFLPNSGILPEDPGGRPPYTPPVEELDQDPFAEAAAYGTAPWQLRVLAQLSGNPPGPMELLQMWNRGIITEEAVERGIREGRLKTKWTSALKELRHFLLSPQEAAGLRLRGWITKAEAEELGALRGASPEVMEALYLNRGRPATTRQVHIGYARGGALPGAANERDAFAKAVAQSNIRTEYTDLLWASRHTYPSAFVIRGLAQAGTFNQAETLDILLESGWPPRYAELAAADWTGGSAGAPSAKWLARARTTLFNRVHTEYTGRQLTRDEAIAGLVAATVPGPEAELVVDLWTIEADLIRTELTQAQIVKAWKKGLYTFEEALAELVERGMAEADARIRLESG